LYKVRGQVFVDGLADSCETYRIKLIAYGKKGPPIKF